MPTDRVVHAVEDYNVGPMAVREVGAAVAKTKHSKAPGPDQIPVEVFKEMDEKGLARAVDILNGWWEGETISSKQESL